MGITGLTLVLLNKRKSDDAGNLDEPARSHKVLPLSEKMKQLHKEKNHMLRLLSGIFCLKLGRRKKICASFAVTLQTTSITASVHDKCLERNITFVQ